MNIEEVRDYALSMNEQVTERLFAVENRRQMVSSYRA